MGSAFSILLFFIGFVVLIIAINRLILFLNKLFRQKSVDKKLLVQTFVTSGLFLIIFFIMAENPQFFDIKVTEARSATMKKG